MRPDLFENQRGVGVIRRESAHGRGIRFEPSRGSERRCAPRVLGETLNTARQIAPRRRKNAPPEGWKIIRLCNESDYVKTNRYELGPAGPGWDRLGPAGTNRYESVRNGTFWREARHGVSGRGGSLGSTRRACSCRGRHVS